MRTTREPRSMQRARAAIGVAVSRLQKNVGATFSLDRMRCFLDEPIAEKARDLGIDCVINVPDGGIDTGRVVWIEFGGDDFILERLESLGGFFEEPCHLV